MGEKIEAEKTRSLVRFLGIWLSGKAQDMSIKNKCKSIVRQFIKSLSNKRLTNSQLTYINNMCLIPKLSYILQTTKLPKSALEEIQRPIIKLIKNKADFLRTISNYLISHRNIENCKLL